MTDRPILVTLPQSHYCEKARWALDRAGVRYQEEPHLVFFHVFANLRRGGKRTTPVLVKDGKTFFDSTDILVHLDRTMGPGSFYPTDPELREEVESLEDELDERFGPHTRRWAYAEVLVNPWRDRLMPVMSRGAPSWQLAVLPVLKPIAWRLLRKGLDATPEGGARSLARIDAVFDQIGRRLEDGRRYLVGDRFTAADLTFAALAAPVVAPPENRAAFPALDELPPTMRAQIDRFRDTPAGQLALRLYREERNRSGPLPPT
ncbi:MAG: glutathione S-transferase family protein [Deltaproteobacteria bacterium]|nr:glutathione S-transferase family protein [Deltaproteobacteria bacterium]